MTNLRDFKRNKVLKKDLNVLITEFEMMKTKLIKYKIYREVSLIIESANTGIAKYKKILEDIK